ncbi:MAG: CRISPR-associated helicase Cas3' [Desulfurococcaceae archaeon]|nr:CRISPR-associated helicase Cas3' [Desulfurococcaceae archaeon]
MQYGSAEMLVDVVYDSLLSGRNVVLVAPTGFGKTLLSPHLFLKARSEGFAFNLIHVVPTRALVKEIYEEKFAWLSGEGYQVGYQSQDRLEGGGKSSFYLRDIVVTTLDSFLWNIYRIPVAEIAKVVEGKSQGHFYPVLASILTSIVVFDEAHLYLGEGSRDSRTLMVPVLRALKTYRVPFVIETATLPSTVMDSVLEDADIDRGEVDVVYVCSRCNSQVDNVKNRGFNVKVVSPGEEYYKRSKYEWETMLVSQEQAMEEALELSEEKLVLVVLNTVKRAVNFYKSIDQPSKVLIHGMLTERDRAQAYEKIKRLKEDGRGVIVSTQVIEVGVEVDADILISDLAPVENIAQRAGRLCRSGRPCRPQVLLIEPLNEKLGHGVYDEEIVRRTLEEIRGRINSLGTRAIEWRLLDSENGRVSYVDMLETLYEAKPQSPSRSFLADVASQYLEGEASPHRLISFLNDYNAWDAFKSTLLVKLLIEEGDPKEDFVVTGLDKASRMGECLDVNESGVKIAVLTVKERGLTGLEYMYSRTVKEALGFVKRKFSPSMFVRGLRGEFEKLPGKVEGVRDLYILVKRSCYVEGEGIVFQA